MKYLSNIRPRYIIAVTVVVSLLMFGSAFYEYNQGRNELLQVLRENSLSLAETIERSSANVVLSAEQIESQLADRLLNNAYFIAQMDSTGSATQDKLRRICDANDIFRIFIVDRSGRMILSSHSKNPADKAPGKNIDPLEVLHPILTGETDQIIIGYERAIFEQGRRFAVAIRRTNKAHGAIVLNVDAAQFVDFRRRIGIGKLINDLGDNAGVEYIAIQDSEGILAASRQVKEMSSFEDDSFLTDALQHDSVITRNIFFNGRKTFEVVRQLSIDGATAGVVRIGLSMDELRSAEERMIRRLFIMSIILAAIGTLVFSAIVVNQHYKTVSEKFSQFQSLAGNILENMRDAVISLDSQNRISLFNRESELLFDTNAKSVLGKNIEDLQSPVRDCLEKIFREDGLELTLECSRGRFRILSISISSTQTPDGLRESRTAVIKDFTEARQMERDIRRKEKLTAMGELASGVAHEIRNPLNAISMIAQRYEEEFIPQSGMEEYRNLTKVLKEESARVNNIIRQFLNYSRPPKLIFAEVSVRQFVSHVSTLFKAQAEKQDIRFISKCDYDGTVRIDQDAMTQALLNILQNALDAVEEQGSITLHVFKKEKQLILEIVDNGRGIPDEEIEKIFNLYYTTKTKGSGIGLAITQQIVSQHQGNIKVKSEIGKGSTFTMSIPAEGSQ
jgi:two-component system sensor histidine kinase HydH